MRFLFAMALLVSRDYRGPHRLAGQLPVVHFAERPPVVYGDDIALLRMDKDVYVLATVLKPIIIEDDV